jgi:hypothetical protein
MGRAALLLLVAAAAAGCTLDPAGRCDARADCAPGLDCLRGVCAACAGDGDCGAWQACGADGLCEAVVGSCDDAGDCRSWEGCGADHHCALLVDGVHCADDGDCTVALETCDPAHHCSLPPGACAGDGDCPVWAPTCSTNACQPSTTAGADVLVRGTLVEGRCDRGAVSPATTAGATGAVLLGLSCGAGADLAGYVDPVDGSVVYRQAGAAGGDTLRRLHADALGGVAGAWTFPPAPEEDDPIAIATDACPESWDRWVMQGGTGELLVGCPLSGGQLWEFRDAAGVRPLQGIAAFQGGVRELHAWNAGGRVLVTTSGGALVVGTAYGLAAPVAVTGLPAGAWFARRTTATGFRVALHDDGTGDDALWEIPDAGGAASLVGTYADPSIAYFGVSWEVLDADGSLYGRAAASAREVILKRPISGGPVSEVYSEAAMASVPGANDFTAEVFAPFLRLDGSYLFAMP